MPVRRDSCSVLLFIYFSTRTKMKCCNWAQRKLQSLTASAKNLENTMTIRAIIILIFGSLISCNVFSPKITDLQKHLDSITYDAKLCDTCISTLIVRHQECTECSDLYIDSGTVFISSKVIAQFDSESKKNLKDKDNIFYSQFKRLNTSDLLLDNKNDFYKLWPDTVTWKDWGKKYRVTGRITEYKGMRLKFKLLDYKLLDTLYAKKFNNP